MEYAYHRKWYNVSMTKVFNEDVRSRINGRVLEELNANEELTGLPFHSPRSVGDAVEEFLCEAFPACVPKELVESFDSSFSRRAMADFAFHDCDGNYLRIDSKTHCADSDFNMPNLTSVERLARFYQDDSNYFSVLKSRYELKGGRIHFTECEFVPIEFLDWSCLTIGALGWGQIQIANARNVLVNVRNTRKQWMLELCDRLDLFYPKEIEKIKKRVEFFADVRSFWEAK